MQVALVVISDRGDLYLPRCLESIEQHLPFPFTQTIILEDPEHRWTASGAVREAWGQVEGADFVWHMEEDFLLREPVDVEAMATVLDAHEDLAQMCLVRNAWNDNEVACGGIIQQWPDDFHDRETRGYPWVEHRKFFSLNPSLVPRRIFQLGYDEGSEPVHTTKLVAAGYRFGYWGARDDPPLVEHIGNIRAAGSLR